MSRLLVLVPVLIWFTWHDHAAHEGVAAGHAGDIVVFLGGLLVLVLAVATTAVGAARGRVGDDGRHDLRLTIYQAIRAVALPAVLAWFAAGLFRLGWGDSVMRVLSDWGMRDLPVALPGVLLATLPVYLAWGLLFVGEYPVVRRRRESRILMDLEMGLPVRPPPPPVRYVTTAVRTRLLFALVPLALVLALRDVILTGAWIRGIPPTATVETVAVVMGVAMVIGVSPVLLTKILPTSPLPPGPLRSRLEGVSAAAGVKVREVLVWHTDGGFVNAAVVGFLPRLRYVLLTDLLLETMPPRQVEAVFAHEAGHVRHRHLLWYVVFLTAATFLLAGPGEALWQAWRPTSPTHAEVAAAVLPGVYLALILLGFGLLSRQFEREADVFAARLVGTPRGPGEPGVDSRRLPVVPEGAAVFGDALRNASPPPVRRSGCRAWPGRVVDQMTHFMHGTAPSRIAVLHAMAVDPRLTRRFDLRLSLVRLALLAAVGVSVPFLL